MDQPRYILGFDTAMSGCSASLYDVSGQSFATQTKDTPRGQAEFLVPMIQQAIADGGATFKDVDLIATTIGPGAFTGLRIGLSTARTLGLALSKPVVGCTTLDVLAKQFFEADSINESAQLFVLIETKRKDFYVQVYDAKGTSVTEPEALSFDAVMAMTEGQNPVFIGDALTRFQSLMSAEQGQGFDFRLGFEQPSPEAICRLCYDYYLSGNLDDFPADPLYLRDADVSQPKNKPRYLAK
jgi:tRNA threonylcarbamoyladenosine biosynthesis protein TsaB